MAFKQHFDDFFGDNPRKRERSRSRPPVDKNQKAGVNIHTKNFENSSKVSVRVFLSNLSLLLDCDYQVVNIIIAILFFFQFYDLIILVLYV